MTLVLKILKISWIPSLVFIGTVLNLLTIIVFFRIKKNILSFLMICLGVLDIGVLVIPVLFTWIDETFFDYYFLNNTICKLSAHYNENSLV